MIYQVCHGKGSMLMAMNYPYGELMFLTDMQASVTLVLKWIQNNLINVCDCVPGIVHVLNIYLLPVAGLFVFYILKYLNVSNLIAAVFSVLIIFLSPQMIRFGGHFGLAYPFVIPMAIWWLLRKHTYGKFEIVDGVVLTALVFFTFNNPYVGISAAGFLVCAALVYAVRALHRKEAL